MYYIDDENVTESNDRNCQISSLQMKYTDMRSLGCMVLNGYKKVIHHMVYMVFLSWPDTVNHA